MNPLQRCIAYLDRKLNPNFFEDLKAKESSTKLRELDADRFILETAIAKEKAALSEVGRELDRLDEDIFKEAESSLFVSLRPEGMTERLQAAYRENTPRRKELLAKVDQLQQNINILNVHLNGCLKDYGQAWQELHPQHGKESTDAQC